MSQIVEELGRIAMSQSLAASLARASGYAQAQLHREVWLEHLLLALTEDPDAAGVLTASNVDIARLNADVSEVLGRIEDRNPPERAGQISVSPDLKRILEAAGAAASKGRRRDINGAIVLAAIVGEGRTTAAHLLRAQGLTFEEAIRVLRAPPPPVAAPPALPHAPAPYAAPSPQQAEPPPQPQPRQRSSTEDILASARERVQRSRHEAAGATAKSAAPAPEPAALPTPPTEPYAEAYYEAPPQAYAEPAPQPPALPEYAPEPSPEQAARAEQGWADPHWHSQPAEANASVEPAPAPPPAPAAWPQPEPRQPPPVQWTEPEPQRSEPGGYAVPGIARPAPAYPPVIGPLSIPGTGAPHGYHEAPQPPQYAPWGEPQPAPQSYDAGPAYGGAGQAAGYPAPALEQPYAQPAAEGPAYAPAPVSPSAQRAPRRGAAPGVEAGQLVENIPRVMRKLVPAVVEVRVAKADVPGLIGDLAAGGASAYRHELNVTKAMSVRLRAPDGGFFIETASPETQWIESTLGLMSADFASWRWTVTPRATGKRRLQLIVAARTAGADGLAAETVLPERVFDVTVKTNYGLAARTWGAWIAAAIMGGVLSKFGQSLIDAGTKLATLLKAG